MSDHERAQTPERILHHIDWHVIRRLDGLLQGDYRSLFYGYGIDFADLREYQPQDDVRAIDWNVTARMDTPYVRQYIEERELAAWFLLDLSPSVDFGSLSRPKRSVQVDFVAAIARLLTRHGNRVGAMLYGSRLEKTIPPRSGRVQALRLLNELLRRPEMGRAPLTDLAPLLNAALGAIKRRSLIFVLSDFICVPGWERPLTMLARHHEVIAVRLWDRRELELPEVGPLIIEDAETGEQLYVDTRDRKFRQRFAEASQRREADLADAFRQAGVAVLPLATDDDLVRAIMRFATMRRGRRG